MNLNNIIDQLKTDEGFRCKPYICPAGKLTIGYGRNIEDRGISKSEAEHLLIGDVESCVREMYENFKWFPELPDRIQEALVNMCFNLGINRFKKFVKAIAAFERLDYLEAAKELKDSRWYNQVGSRAQRIVRTVSGGVLS